jgi:hypothetical protein
MSLEIKWIDRVAADGGGTQLLVKVGGATKHDEAYTPDHLEEARKVAMGYLQQATFENVLPARGVNV